MNTYEYLLKDINTIKGIGPKLSKLFRKKNINTIFDLIWSIPRDTTDRRDLVKVNELQIGKVQTITVDVVKYNFPRIRNLPSKVYCQDETAKIECVFFKTSFPLYSSSPTFNKAILGVSFIKSDLNNAEPIHAKSVKFFSLHSILAPRSRTTFILF